ncbi:MAG TPA: FISUMP domain-containing protein [Bacteroidales bacterium]|nr:FISUMP domain-containing protein [Bacteroidales bacterium]
MICSILQYLLRFVFLLILFLPGDLFNPADGAVNIGSNTIFYIYSTVYNCLDTATQSITVLPSNAGYICGSALLSDPRDPSISYRTYPIGTKCWMAENIRIGSRVVLPSQNQPQNQSDNCIIEKYCLPSDNINCTNYGGLYQWDELIQYGQTQFPYQGLCPPGWHVPTAAEWSDMIDQVAQMSPGVGLASLLQYASGFNAKLKGLFYLYGQWAFTSGDPTATMYWTSSKNNGNPIARGLNSSNLSVSYYESSKANAFTVRCVKD